MPAPVFGLNDKQSSADVLDECNKMQIARKRAAAQSKPLHILLGRKDAEAANRIDEICDQLMKKRFVNF